MEIPVLLEAPGTVRAVKVAPGDVVQGGRRAGRGGPDLTRGLTQGLTQRGRDSNPR